MSLWEGFPEAGEVERLTLGPNDRLVVTYPRMLSQMDAERIKRRISLALGDVPVVILDCGAELSVIEEESGG